MFQKIPPKFHDKTVQSNILWLNLNKINEIFFYNQHINKVTPHSTFMRRAQDADTHALKQHRLSQNIFPVCSTFVLVIASDMHLEPQSENVRKTFIFTQLKTPRYNPHFFAIFDLPPIYCSLTSAGPLPARKRFSSVHSLSSSSIP